ncbi:MAG: Abi family protein, partial [Anaerolineae bacterium]|nr:Abi family protein [Anaerolineae bacterium]
MRYNKPALSFDQQAELLIERGVEAEKPNLIEFLRQVNYYRVSGYLYPFKESADSEGFIEGTILTEIKKRYYFDSELRLLILSA